MEKNYRNLQNAIQQLPGYEPEELLWDNVTEMLNELPLYAAIHALPAYEPDEKLWGTIAAKSANKKTALHWWYLAAAMLTVGLSISILINITHTKPEIAYSVEKVDTRLQNSNLKPTDIQYKKLKAYCETETLVCSSQDYKRLQTEYEKLNEASVRLKQAIGEYNTEVQLVKQYIFLEEQKADILNEMAKMI